MHEHLRISMILRFTKFCVTIFTICWIMFVCNIVMYNFCLSIIMIRAPWISICQTWSVQTFPVKNRPRILYLFDAAVNFKYRHCFRTNWKACIVPTFIAYFILCLIGQALLFEFCKKIVFKTDLLDVKIFNYIKLSERVNLL